MKINKSFIVLFGLMGLATSFTACSDWGKMDPAAGIDIYPTHAKTATYAFNESMDFTELGYVKSVEQGTVCEIVEDDSLNSQVLHLVDGAKVHLFNALSKSAGVTLQNAAGFTFWLRALKDAPGTLQLNAGGQDFPLPISELLSDGCLHFMGVQARKDAFDIYADAQLLTSIANDNTALIAAINENEEVIFGSQNGEFWIDDISFIRNLFVEKDLARPTIKKGRVKLPDPVYLNDFNSGAGDATIVGAGSIRTEDAPGFGKVFQNVAGAKSTNYLKLPSHILSHSAETQEMTIGFWVNAASAGNVSDYTYSPFFAAYNSQPTADNGMPMMVFQSRGPIQLNNNGWCDFTGANHVDGKVNIYNENAWEAGDGSYNFVNNWLDDGQWHFYAVTFTANEVTVYMDGKIANQWELDGQTEGQQVTGLFNNGSDFTWPCLGGAQAWNWGDPDAGFAFDDFVVYDEALTSAQIGQIIEDKPTGGSGGGIVLPTPVFFSDFTNTAGLKIVGGGSFTKDNDSHFGDIFQNVTGGMRQNYLLLPEDALSHSAETKQMSIGVWVNAANAGASPDYMWAPLFMAYTAAPVNNENTLPMFACQYRGVLQVNNNGWTDYTDVQNVAGANKLFHNETDWLADKQWHYYTAVFDGENAKVYLDGVLVNEWEMDGNSNTQMGLFTNGADLKYICLGGNQAWNWGDPDPGFAFDDIAIYDIALDASDIQNIMDVKMGNVPVPGPTPYYRNTFESTGDVIISGGGSFVTDPVHGTVFQNITGGMRKNYLLLPEDLLAHSADTHQLSISVWVNAAKAGASADYMWAPLFMAYTAAPANNENTLPMFACQYRGVLQVNNNGWTDYTDQQNVAGVNKLYHNETDWLADKEWHLYTAVFDGENAKVYLDGVLANEWQMDGTANTQMGLFTNGADLKYICLGGNQAWNWADNDPGFAFDDLQLFNFALSEADIQAILKQY